jgi:hypothetical protein
MLDFMAVLCQSSGQKGVMIQARPTLILTATKVPSIQKDKFACVVGNVAWVRAHRHSSLEATHVGFHSTSPETYLSRLRPVARPSHMLGPLSLR